MSETKNKVVLRNFTVEHLFDPSVYAFSGYDDISLPVEIYNQIVWLYFVPLNVRIERVRELLNNYLERIQFIERARKDESEFVLFTLSSRFPRVIFKNANFDYDAAVSHFNEQIHDFANYDKSMKIINLDNFLNKYRTDEVIDWKFFYLSQMLPSPALAKQFKEWFKLKTNAIDQVRKKCIILDLDNTLWGGILGEDGIGGIKLGGGYPGNVFKELQFLLKDAAKHGVILSVASKNNESDVLEAWEKHPEMVLSQNDFLSHKINWADKAENIICIADELNIGLDSIVFLDDSAVERDRVRSALPQVVVPEFPKEPYLLVDWFAGIYAEYFQAYSLTDEDRSKTEQYKAMAERNRFQSKVSSVEQFIEQLEIGLTFHINKTENVQRIAQMTQKTNQFNVTTRRYTESDITRFMADGFVYDLAVRDKFGDSGIAAAAIVRVKSSGNAGEIDSFLLSCRILGRGIEDVFLRLVLNDLYSRNVVNVLATYLPTRKNCQTREFYEGNGFGVLESLADGGKRYCILVKSEFVISSNYKVELGK